MSIQMIRQAGIRLLTGGKYCPDNIDVVPTLQEKTATENGEIIPDDGYVGLSKVTVAMEEYDGSVRDEIPVSLTSSDDSVLTDSNGTIITTEEEV